LHPEASVISLPPSEPTDRSTVLIVDDAPENLTVLGEVLSPYFKVRAANSGLRALRIAGSEPRPDLILLDIMMPEMDGYTVLEHLRADVATRDIPVIFVTAMDAIADEEKGLKLGAVDYITKPIQPAIVVARVNAHIELKQARDWLRDQNAFLEAEVTRRMEENLLVQDVSIRALAHLAEVRDPETGNHLLRTQNYMRTLAERLSHHPRFEKVISARLVNILAKSAPLHDIGKVGIPDTILHKPGRLTPEEWVIMKTHAKIGSDAIEHAERDAERPIEFLATAKEIAHWHHEKWDGSGYPDGLAGTEIPVSARLMALADVFDALISRRIYKPPMSAEQATQIILEGSGRHFDPDVVDAFMADRDVFLAIAERYVDTDAVIMEKAISMGMIPGQVDDAQA
jgi:putative two-component system response regulator